MRSHDASNNAPIFPRRERKGPDRNSVARIRSAQLLRLIQPQLVSNDILLFKQLSFNFCGTAIAHDAAGVNSLDLLLAFEPA